MLESIVNFQQAPFLPLSPPGLEYFPLNPIMRSLPWEFLALNRDFVIARTFSTIFTPYFKTLTRTYETKMKTTSSLLLLFFFDSSSENLCCHFQGTET